MTRPRSGVRGRRLARIVVLVCAAAVTLTGCDFSVYSLPLPGGADLGDHPYSVHVEFRDVLDLVPQSSVKVDDVTVGKVDKIELSGWSADVTVLVRGDVELPANAEAEIRQTSLLGEKFVALSPPASGPSATRLRDGDVIPLAQTGRNPEVEEVLGALSLLLNGGGVAQLKTIASELNQALGGRESDVRSLLGQLSEFMGQIDQNKAGIVQAIDSLNKLAVSLNKQQATVDLALDELPGAVASINRQRDDLVEMLTALSRLSAVGTRVIRESKTATIDSLQALAPTLTKLAEAGDALPKSLQVFLTYPFVDSVVGKNPVQARNLHMGDYTNLSAQLDISLANGLPTLPALPAPPDVCQFVPAVGKRLCGDALDGVLACLKNPGLDNTACAGLPQRLLDALCENTTGRQGGLCGVVPAPTPSQLEKCFASGRPTGPACQQVRAQTIVYQCTHPKAENYDSDTCTAYRKLLGTGGDPGLPGLPGLPPVLPDLTGGLTGNPAGVNRPGFGAPGLRPEAAPSGATSDLGAMLVWGLIER